MNANKINDMLKNAGIDGYASEWNSRRIYINLAACDKSFAGNRSYQLYFDIASKTLVSKMGKGVTTHIFDAEVKKVAALFN